MKAGRNVGPVGDAIAFTMLNRFTFVLTLFLAATLVCSAADISGKWTAQVPGRDGQARETTFTFKMDGEKLTGTVSGMQGRENPISEGKVSGDTVSFVVTMERGGNTMKQTYTGKISGATIQFKRESGQGQAREFVAKKAN
jgi:hypothetical protein